LAEVIIIIIIIITSERGGSAMLCSITSRWKLLQHDHEKTLRRYQLLRASPSQIRM